MSILSLASFVLVAACSINVAMSGPSKKLRGVSATKTIITSTVDTINETKVTNIDTNTNIVNAASTFFQPFYYEMDDAHKTFIAKFKTLDPKAPAMLDNFRTTSLQHDYVMLDTAGKPDRPYSQDKQDVIILDILNNKTDGYFVDLASNDWKMFSNTLRLEMFGNQWKGLCIEPNPNYWTNILSNRKCQLYVNPVSSTTGDVLNFTFNGGHGGLIGEEFDNKAAGGTRVVTVTLNNILDHARAPAVIDYMSLDVEGAEYYAMSKLDFHRYTFMLVTIERPKQKLHHFMIQKGYVFVYTMTHYGECLYAHHTLPNLVSLMDSHVRDDKSATYFGQPKLYLNSPKWTGKYVPPVHGAGKVTDEA